MTRKTAHELGDILILERKWIEIDPIETYVNIGVRSFGKGLFHYQPTVGTDLSKLRFHSLRPGVLVVSNIKAWEGAVALSTDSEKGCIASNRMLTYSARDPDTVDLGYLRYLLISEPGRELLGAASPGSADRNRTLSIKRLESIRVFLPDVEEQHRVARRIDRLYSHISSATALHERSLSLVQASAVSLVVDRAEHEDLNRVLTRIERAEPVVSQARYKLLGARWYGRGLFIKDSKYGNEISATKLYRVTAGDFVYNRLFAWKGSFALATEDHDQCFVSGEFPTFEVNTALAHPEYLLGYFQRPATWDEALAGSTGSTPTSRNRLKVERLLEMSIPLPPMEEQLRIVKLLRRVRQIRAHLERRTAHLDAVPLSVLNQTFTDTL